MNAKTLFKKYNSSSDGLDKSEATKRLSKNGLNVIGSENHLNFLKIILSQFTDSLVIILIVAGTISLFLGAHRDAMVMYLIVILNAAIGFWQQYKTERILDALKNLLPKKARVLRSQKQTEIDSRFLVTGDIVILQAGDAVPADGIILESYNLKTDESSLTGESHYQKKHQLLGLTIEKNEQVFMGTDVVEGEAKILVIECGAKTHFGQIAQQAKFIEHNLTPLQKKLQQVGKTVSYIAVAILLLIIGFELIKIRIIDHQNLEPNNIRTIFLFALALAAAVVPEGLPATVSVALSVSAARLAKKKAVVKRLSSVETLGSTTVICTDKTGTLTAGKMGVVSIYDQETQKIFDYNKFRWSASSDFLACLISCQNVKKTEDKYLGDINEIAFYKSLEEKGIDPEKILQKSQRVQEFSFNPERKMMSVVEKNNSHFALYTKGAPPIILDKCRISASAKKKLENIGDKMAEKGLRIFAFAAKRIPHYIHKHYKAAELEKDLFFLGFVGLEDKIRPEVPEAIQYCQQNAIRIIMVTGDYKITAQSIAEKIKLAEHKTFRMVGPEAINKMTDLELKENLQHTSVFYQSFPEQKYKIVKTLQEMGEIVAVTGDGVNDSLALKQANIGVAMGETGTDVARESADMILMDDNFATIVNAVREGRLIWSNLKKFLFYIFSSNAGEFTVAFLGVLSGLPIPIMAVQILSVDLGTDILPSFALIFDRATAKELSGPPRSKKETLLNKNVLKRLLYIGIIMGGGALLNYFLVNGSGAYGTELYFRGTTAAFATLVVCQIVNVYAVRFENRPVFWGFFSNIYIFLSVLFEIGLLLAIIYWEPLGNFLYTKPLSLSNWLPIIAIGVIFWLAEEWKKYLERKNKAVF